MDHQTSQLTRAGLLERIQNRRAKLDAAIEQLSVEHLDATPAGGWSIKDHLAHITAWEQSMVALLQGRPRYDGLGVDPSTYLSHDVDIVNRRIYEQHHDRPASEVIADFRTSHQELLGVLEGLSDDALARPYSHYLPEEPGEETGEPIVNWIAGNTYHHYDEHLEIIGEIVNGQ